MKKKIVSKVFALLLAACTVLSACGNESGNQSVGQTDKSETNDTVQEGEEPYTIVYALVIGMTGIMVSFILRIQNYSVCKII